VGADLLGRGALVAGHLDLLACERLALVCSD
jgi:hypothetical protein